MSQPDVFALRNSGFDTFLFADVGTESNGSGLTILSVLARLGKDPWTEAALWAGQPTAIAVDALATSIGHMPLTQASLENAHATASRLIGLLPQQSLTRRDRSTSKAAVLVMSTWGWIMLTYLWLFFIMKMGMALVPQPHATPAAATTLSMPPAADRHS